MKKQTKLLITLIVLSSLLLSLSSLSKVTATPKNANAIENSNKNKGSEVNIEKTEEVGETSSNHRSVVSTFVHSLLDVANREGGIGEQVRVIAQQQNDSLEETTEAINKIQNRNRIKTFLIGSDYKNLGSLRSLMVKTRNEVEQLKRLVEKTTTEEAKTELQNQIQILEQEQNKINDFITLNEEKFSLFGWVLKLLNK